jgi:hypothetical protein
MRDRETREKYIERYREKKSENERGEKDVI